MLFHDFSKIYEQAENLRKVNDMIPNYYREEPAKPLPDDSFM